MNSSQTNRVAASAIIHPGVELGENIIIEEFCIIGAPSNGAAGKTVIGDGAHIRSHTVIYAGNIIGKNFHAGNKSNIRENNRIGSSVSLGTLSVIEHHCEIEDDVRIHSQAFIPEYSRLERGAWLGPQVTLTNARYPRSPGVKESLEGPLIGAGAIIGAGATILPGVKIGAQALVGAGSVVTADVASGKVVYGNPARVQKDISELPYIKEESNPE